MTDTVIGIIIGVAFLALIIVLAKLSSVKPRYKTRPGGIHYITREEAEKLKNKKNKK